MCFINNLLAFTIGKLTINLLGNKPLQKPGESIYRAHWPFSHRLLHGFVKCWAERRGFLSLDYFLFCSESMAKSPPSLDAQGETRHYGGRLHLPPNLHQHHGASVSRWAAACELPERHRLLQLPRQARSRRDW